MTCHHIKVGGFDTIVCQRGSRPKLCSCGAPGAKQCDWIVGKTRSDKVKRCNKYICDKHAQNVGPDKDLCPEHQLAYKEWQERRNGVPAGS